MSFDKNIAVVAALGLMLSASAASAQTKGENDSGLNRSQTDELNSGRSMSKDSMSKGGSGGMSQHTNTDTTGRGSSTGGTPGGAPGRS